MCRSHKFWRSRGAQHCVCVTFRNFQIPWSCSGLQKLRHLWLESSAFGKMIVKMNAGTILYSLSRDHGDADIMFAHCYDVMIVMRRFQEFAQNQITLAAMVDVVWTLFQHHDAWCGKPVKLLQPYKPVNHAGFPGHGSSSLAVRRCCAVA